MSEDLSQHQEEDDEIKLLEDDTNIEPGVLTSDKIEYCVEKFSLIQPFDKDLLKPARYKLTLGEDYAMAGELRKLYDVPGKNELTIPPFQVAIVSTRQTLNMPRFLIARWNLDIDRVYDGLLWVGGPQVDPGYNGRLFCPIYNLSDKAVKLKLGDDIASIDFVKTTTFQKGKTLVYPSPPRRKKLSHYNWRLQSALYEMAEKKIGAFEEEIRETTERVNRSIVSIFTVLAILIAAISLVLTRQEWSPIPTWGWVALWLSISALIFSLVPPKTFVSVIKKWLKDPQD